MYILGKLNELDKVSEFFNFIKDHKGLFIFILMAILIGFIVYFIYAMFTDDSNKEIKTTTETTSELKQTHRDVPCKGDLFITYFVLSKSNLMDYLSVKGKFISSIYLSWIKKGFLKTKFVDNQLLFYFNNSAEDAINDDIEKKLYETVKSTVSPTNQEFKIDDLVKCLVNNNQIVVNFLKEAYEEGKNRIIKIVTNSSMVNSDFNVTPYVQELKKQIISFQNYLIEFSKTNEDGFDSTYILDNYYLFANLLGINESIKNSWFIEKVNSDMVKLVNSNISLELEEYAHTNNLYSDEELSSNKKLIKKSEQTYNKDQKKEFIHV